MFNGGLVIKYEEIRFSIILIHPFTNLTKTLISKDHKRINFHPQLRILYEIDNEDK
jgi:hypothetical protein